jgi:hypothetical protein
MKRISFISIALITLFTTSCKDDIDFDYHDIAPKFIIEGSVSNIGAEVIVGKTINMTDTAKHVPVDNASVVITSSDGKQYTMSSVGNGIYHSDNDFKAIAGNLYTLNVDIDNTTYTSYSEMQDSTSIKSAWFAWEKVVSQDELCCHIQFQDIKDQENYYCYRIYRNDSIYKWGVMHDLGYENTLIDKTIPCVSRQTIKDNNKDDRESILFNGDRIRFEILAIDKRTYDYLYSLQLGKGNYANPINNFTGGCLGYFSAHSVSSFNMLFNYDKVTE